MNIGELMTQNPVSLKESDYMTSARQLFREGHWRVIPVINNANNRVLGVLTEREVLAITSTKSNITVAGFITECMIAPIDMDIYEAAVAMCKTGNDHIIVIPSSMDLTLQGIVSVVDLFKEIRPNHTLDIVVGDIMTHNVDSCKPADVLASIWHRLIEQDYTGMPVIDNDTNKALGIITRYDLIKAGCLRRGVDDTGMSRHSPIAPRSMNTPLSRLMNTPLYTIDSQTPVLVAIDEFIKKGVGRLTVVDDENRLIGIVDRYDLLKACVQ